ncbi:MAG: cell division protein FtsA [Pseudolabrys sp.]
MTGKVIRFGLTPKMKPVSPKRAAVVAALDIGTSKIVCMIARLQPQAPQDVLRRRSHGVRVLGFAHTAAAGMKGGAVIDLIEAEQMVRTAIDIAENAAGLQLESVVVSLSGGRLGSERFTAAIELAGGAVGDGDIARVLAAASRHSVRDGRAVLHSLPIGYTVDAAAGIREPRGMLGHHFGVDMHMVTAEVATVRNLMLTVERSHLDIEAMVASPYVAGLSVLADDEADLGAAVIDLGAGTTSLAVYSAGRFVHADGFALGGHHVTMDLARGLNARIADAERIKAIYGSVLMGGSDERDMITVPPVGDDEREPPQFVSRATLTRIIKPRVEEILEMVRDRLKASPFAAEPRGRVVLTGGGSQLSGLPELAARILKRPVRIGRPLGLSGLPDAAKGPAFAVAAGLLIYPQAAHLEHFEPRRTRHLMTGTGGYMARVGRWLRESF